MTRLAFALALVVFASCAARQKPATETRSVAERPPRENETPVAKMPTRSPAVKSDEGGVQNDDSDDDEGEVSEVETPEPKRYGKKYKGKASYYHDGLIGRLTANGERYRARRATCAHKKLPFGTRVEVRAVETNVSVICRVNDRGPFVKGRIIDLSKSLAKKLGMMEKGVIDVEVRVLLDES